MRSQRSARTRRLLSTATAVAMVGTALAAAPAASAAPTTQSSTPVVGAETLAPGAGAAGPMDLTGEGGIDWLHPTGSGVEQKKTDDHALGLKALDASLRVATLTDSPVRMSWSDGTSTSSKTGATDGAVYNNQSLPAGDVSSQKVGYTLTVAPAQQTRRLTVVTGGWQADSTFTVASTASSDPIYTKKLSTQGSALVKRYTVTIAAGQGATITSKLTRTYNQAGNVSLMAATLADDVVSPAVAFAQTPSTMNLTKEGTVDWLHLSGATVNRSADGDGSLQFSKRDADGTINKQSDNPVTWSWSNGTPTTSQSGTQAGAYFKTRDSDVTKPWGWNLSVAASKARTLQFVAGVYQSSATVSVDLGEGPAAATTLSTTSGSVTKLYTVHIPAGSAATVSAQLNRTSGNVTLAGAALSNTDGSADLTRLIAQVGDSDVEGTDDFTGTQLDTELAAAKAAQNGSAEAVATAWTRLSAAFVAAQNGAGDAQYTFNSNAGLTSSFGWEGDKNAPIAFIDGSYRLRDQSNTMITFGVPDIPGKIKWYNAEGYLPSFISEYSKNGLDITVQSFSDEATVDGNRFEIAYSRMTVRNGNSTAVALPKVSRKLIGLTASITQTTVAPGATVTRDYAVGADRFGGSYAWPSDEKIAALGSFDTHYRHMRSYWNKRVSGIAQITALPDKRLIDAYKAGYIYTLIIRDDVDGQKQLHVGENGYDRMYDHDTIGIVSTLLTMGDFTYAKDYLATLPAQLQYQDAKWKYSAPFAIYLQRTGDATFVKQHFDTIKENTRTIAADREDGGAGVMKITNAIDSNGHWTVDNWSALYGLSTYRYVATTLGQTAEADWAKAEYDSLLKAVTAKITATQTAKNLTYIPMAVDQANEEGPRKDPRDANWASMFLFGGWGWGSYLYGMPQASSMLTQIDQTYAYGIERRKDVSDSPYNFGGYPHGYYSSAYNAGYGSAALRGEKYRDIGIKAYQFMIDHSQSGPFGWWEGVNYPSDTSPWNISHASGGGGSNQHMWGQAMGSNVLWDALISLKSDGSVILGRGVPSEWVAAGKKVAVSNFPVSNGGRIGYSMTTSGKTVTVRLTGDRAKVSATSIELAAARGNISKVRLLGAGSALAGIDQAGGRVRVPKGTTEVRITLGRPAAWSARATYDVGDVVAFDGSTWQAGWWTRGQKPGSPTGAWQEMKADSDGVAAWTASRVFTAGEVATYRGVTYRAKWWTRNQVPGVSSGPWEVMK
ncbi:carbohydrate-binding protein [Acidipropionibacterium virtanenii]|uniref:Chitin-binding type-3 domain-containing protein n=1 Tax=Acidipropionibacterium virtanenii TaxID=2057246 RepID=A0A344UQK9_9ACTN|nr:carbohydrate-binding protein [Acidipropionibacterium virtanenii]AXE37557.1 hypothetical protein JS278_00360 [Acidipropionibacterium virtanenii]